MRDGLRRYSDEKITLAYEMIDSIGGISQWPDQGKKRLAEFFLSGSLILGDDDVMRFYPKDEHGEYDLEDLTIIRLILECYNGSEDEGRFRQIGDQLVQLPLVMHNLGHRTIKGHIHYVPQSQCPLYWAFLNWFKLQTPESWAILVEEFGGKADFDAMAAEKMRMTVRSMGDFLAEADR